MNSSPAKRLSVFKNNLRQEASYIKENGLSPLFSVMYKRALGYHKGFRFKEL